MNGEYKRCPYCDEEIRINARICRFCNREVSNQSAPESHYDSGRIIVEQLKGKYEIMESLGSGGMAGVYKARQSSLGRLVALKIIHQSFIHDEEFVQRFHREAKLSATLRHPNIITLYDVGRIGTVHFMAMELLEGQDLHSYIVQKGQLSVDETVTIGVAMAGALGYAHTQGIYHRDVKTSNIFLHKDGRRILTDFGIAKAALDSGLTQAGVIIGTPEFMSPEQAQGKPLDARSDLYSLGVVLYECLTGQVPFRDRNKMTVISRVINDDIPDMRLFNPQLPEWIISIVMKLLSKVPERRFRSGEELALALEERRSISNDYRKKDLDSGRYRQRDERESADEKLPSNRSRNIALIILMLATIITIGIIGVLFLE